MRGRKIKKIFWYFLIFFFKGMDYYELVLFYMLMSDEINLNLNRFFDLVVESYLGVMFEVFGNYRDVFRRIFFFY